MEATLERRVRKTKPRINVEGLKVPEGVEVRVMKTAVVFAKGARKAVLKGRALEVTNPVKTLGDRLKTFTQEMIEACHLGTSRGIVSGVKDTIDLEKILARYFK